jgi:hypothetical protein
LSEWRSVSLHNLASQLDVAEEAQAQLSQVCISTIVHSFGRFWTKTTRYRAALPLVYAHGFSQNHNIFI